MSIKVNSKIKLNNSKIKLLDKVSVTALEQTGEALVSEVRNDGVIPFDTGTLQNDNTSASKFNSSTNTVQIVSNTPYARRLYYHPELNFQKTNNSRAGAEWFDDYVNGPKLDFVRNAYAELYKRGTGL